MSEKETPEVAPDSAPAADKPPIDPAPSSDPPPVVPSIEDTLDALIAGPAAQPVARTKDELARDAKAFEVYIRGEKGREYVVNGDEVAYVPRNERALVSAVIFHALRNSSVDFDWTPLP